ncbi:MAG: hypothetical protein NVV74_14050 [Magnetospirillum sp.]|nr:hypothetical protein [Magnetospirillum sp.]
MHKRIGLALLAAVAFSTPAAAEEQGNDWLGAVGDFVRAGLGPPRTAEDLRREEGRARDASDANPEGPKAKSEQPRLVQPVPASAPVPAAEPELAAPVPAAPAVVSHRSAAVAPAPESRAAAKPAAPAAAPVPPPRPVRPSRRCR